MPALPARRGAPAPSPGRDGGRRDGERLLALGLLLGLEGHALLAVVVCAALPTAQNVFGYAVRFGQGVVLGRDAGLATTLVSAPVLFAVVALLD